MPPRKKKVKVDDEAFSKPRRSSLQVNLSFTSNISDLGHDSCRKPEDSQIRLLSEKEAKNSLPKILEVSQKKERKLPKIVNIQRHFDYQEQLLSQQCSDLRNEILEKTKKMFDEGSELVVKTKEVLQEGSRILQDFSDSVILEKDSRSIILEPSPKILESNPKSSAFGETSTCVEKCTGSVEKNSESLSLNLVDLKNCPNSTSVKRLLSLSSRKSLTHRIVDKDPVAEEKGSDCAKVRESNREPKKSLGTMILEMSSNTRSALLDRLKESRLIPKEKRISTGNESKSPSVRVALNEREQLTMSFKSKNTGPVSLNVMESPVSSRKLAGAETPRNSRLSSTPNDRPSFPRKRLFSDENDPENVPELKTPIQKSILENSSPKTFLQRPEGRIASPILGGSCKKRFNLSLRKNRYVDHRKDKISTEETSSNLSEFPDLPLTCSSFIDNRNQNKNSGSNMDITAVSNVLPIAVRSSMKKILRRETSPKSSQDKNIVSMELTKTEGNILGANSVKKVLRSELENEAIDDASIRTSLNVNTSLNGQEVGQQFEEEFPSETKRRRMRNSRSLNSTGGIGDKSHVDGTPFHISRPFMWKSQIKQLTFASNLNDDSVEEISCVSVESEEKRKRTNTSKESERHPALESSDSEPKEKKDSSRESTKVTESSRSLKLLSSDDNSRKQGKKKLYRLRGRSQILSLSPVTCLTPTPKPSQFPPRRKNKKWQKMKEMKSQKPENQEQTQKTQRSLRTLNKRKTQKDSESEDSESEDALTLKPAKKKKPRKVLRKKIIIKPAPGTSTQSKGKSQLKTIEKIKEDDRSSFSDFEPVIKKPVKKIVKIYIVMTGFSNGDKALVKSIVKELGKAVLETNVSRKTTHVVSTGVRTINLLKGILRGCWLVSLDWVLNSLEHNDWQNPEPFEMAPFATAVQVNRRDRQLFGNAFVPELFSTCGLIYVEKGTNPAPQSLKELIKAAGGQITENPAVAKIIIGSEGLKEIWILDSITTGKLQSKNQYRKS